MFLQVDVKTFIELIPIDITEEQIQEDAEAVKEDSENDVDVLPMVSCSFCLLRKEFKAPMNKRGWYEMKADNGAANVCIGRTHSEVCHLKYCYQRKVRHGDHNF